MQRNTLGAARDGGPVVLRPVRAYLVGLLKLIISVCVKCVRLFVCLSLVVVLVRQYH